MNCISIKALPPFSWIKPKVLRATNKIYSFINYKIYVEKFKVSWKLIM